MKKYAKILVAILLISLLATALFACINPDNDTSGEMTLVVIDGDDVTEYTVDLAKIPSGNSSKGLIPILDYLKAAGKLTYVSQPSAYGDYITQVNTIIPQGNEYVAFYTSVEKDFSTDEYAKTITHKGVKCTTSGLGASSMSILDGCTVIITRGTF